MNDHRLQGETWYAWIDRTVWQPQCVRCHSGPSAAAGLDVSSRESLLASGSVVPFQPEKSSLYAVILSGEMPKGGHALPADVIERVRKWIAAGAPEDKALEPPPPPKPEPRWGWLLTNVFQTKCLCCHQGEKPKGDVDLSSYRALMASEGLMKKPVEPGKPEDSGVYTQVAEGLMPQGPDKLSPETREAIAEWIRRGALDD